MGSDEAGAASAIRGLGSEPCGERCVCDDCGLPSRAPPMARMAALRRLAEPGTRQMRVPRRARTAPHGSGADTERGNGSLRNPQLVTSRTRRFLSSRIVTETLLFVARIAAAA